jgi:hypothetical protein
MSNLSNSFRSYEERKTITETDPPPVLREEWWKPNKADRKVLTTIGIYTGAGLVFLFGAAVAVRLHDARQAMTTHIVEPVAPLKSVTPENINGGKHLFKL